MSSAGDQSSSTQWVELKLVRGLARRTERQLGCVRGLGLRRVGSTSRLKLTPEVQGMINKVIFLLEVKYPSS